MREITTTHTTAKDPSPVHLNRRNFVCALESDDKYEAIHELLNGAPVFEDLECLDRIERAVVTRERIQSTGLGHGVAVAHGKCEEVGDLAMALGISWRGIDFGALDDEPVHFLFVVANPPGMQLEYLLALSVIVRVIRDDRFRRELLSSRSIEEIERRLIRALAAAMRKRGFPFA